MPLVRKFLAWFGNLRWSVKIAVAIPLSMVLLLVLAAFTILAVVGLFLLLDLLWDRMR